MKNLLVAMMSVLMAACATYSSAEDAAERRDLAFKNFITRDGVQLSDGDEEFRFLAVNIPTLWYIEDDWAFDRSNPFRLPTEFEIRDVLGAARQLGSNVVRAYTIPVRNTNLPTEAVTFVEAPGVFNEEAFRTMDLAIAVAAENNIRVVIPLVNNWEWMGGRPNYAAFRGMDSDAFCSDPQLREDFKQTIRFVLNRVNTVTGVRYNEDPTVMAWETGNEMTCPPEWGIDIARTIKALAPRQLVIDGWHAVHMPYQGEILRDFPTDASINEPAIDLVSTHHYEEDPAAMVRNLRETVERVGGRKPVFVGEFGFMSPPAMERVYDYIISEPAIPGGMIWSLRRHHNDGGWLHHSEPLGAGLYRAYHWPGFDDGEPFGERAFLSLLRKKAYQIRGVEAPILSAPPAPELLPIRSAGAISWRGAVGASSYTIERATDDQGPWAVIATDIDDIGTPGFALFSDTDADLGEAYFYRVRARNGHGISIPSNIVGPVRPNVLTLVDRARSFGIAARWRSMTLESGDFAKYKEAYSRLRGEVGSEIVYTVPERISEIRVYSYEAGEQPQLTIDLAGLSEQWSEGLTDTAQYEQHRGLYPRLYTVRPKDGLDTDLARIAFAGRADLVRVEVDYGAQPGASTPLAE